MSFMMFYFSFVWAVSNWRLYDSSPLTQILVGMGRVGSASDSNESRYRVKQSILRGRTVTSYHAASTRTCLLQARVLQPTSTTVLPR